MTWTYDASLRLTVPLHEVRFLIGDINKTAQQLQDEDIEFILTRNGNSVRKAAWKAAEQMVAIYAQKSNVSIGPIQVLNNQRFQQWKELAQLLRNEYLFPGGGKVTNIATGAMANRDALGQTRLGPYGQWQKELTETGTGGGSEP